jgi:hypothetical protein
MKEGNKLRQIQKLYEKQVKQKRVEVIKKLKYQKEQKKRNALAHVLYIYGFSKQFSSL